MKSTEVTNWETQYNGLSTTQDISRISTFSYGTEDSWLGKLQALNSAAKNLFENFNFGYTIKNVHKP